ncbi:MAG: RNA polymerase sigma factor [Ignavibacteria bacterium]|jgi:RNA polymerase sigma-70 factor (ECF subfamily)
MSHLQETKIEQVFSGVFYEHKDKIYNLAFKMTGDKEIAEDITQETFINGYMNIEKFRGESHIYTWLYSIAKNNCLRYLENKKRSKVSNMEKLIYQHSSYFDEQINEIEKRNYFIQIKEGCLIGLLNCLSFYQRLAFILNIVLNVQLKETAKILEKSESATRTLIHRARKSIKEFLCKNCSLYNPQNKCRCENLINFSLKQNWIKANHSYPPDISLHIKSELKDLEKVTALYNSLPQYKSPDSISQKIKEQIRQKDFLIYSQKKVK